MSQSTTKEAADFMLETLKGIAEADWRKWEELASPEEFVRWAQSRARHAVAKAEAAPTPTDTRSTFSGAADYDQTTPFNGIAGDAA